MPPWYSSPNAAFIDDPNVVSDKRLDSRSFFVSRFAYERRLTFRHNFNFEASSEDPDLGFDGGVLELSVDGNTFQYVPSSAFLLGGYNRTISPDRGSPIAGLQAWSGNSEGFITTTVNLPPMNSNNVKLRWRMASDSSGSSEGWRVDNANVTVCDSATPTPTASVPPSPTPTATATITPSATPTATATATATTSPRPVPPPRSRPTPAPRPSP
jgi:hypothetical protein